MVQKQTQTDLAMLRPRKKLAISWSEDCHGSPRALTIVSSSTSSPLKLANKKYIANSSSHCDSFTRLHNDLWDYTQKEKWLIDWLLNGTSTQKGQHVPSAGEGNRLSRQMMANEIQCIVRHVTWDNNVTRSTVKHSSYTNATTGYLIVWLTYYYVSAFTNTKPDPTHPIRYL